MKIARNKVFVVMGIGNLLKMKEVILKNVKVEYQRTSSHLEKYAPIVCSNFLVEMES